MKQFTFTVLAAMLLALCAAPAGAKTPKKKTAEKLLVVERDRDALRLERNRLMWASYLDYVRRTGRIDDVMQLKAVNIRRLCDTVPELRELSEAYDKAYKAWQETLRTDSLYEEIHDEYLSLKGINDREAMNANTQRYNRMYARLAKSNPEYVPARNAKNETRRARDLAALEYLVSLYGQQGRSLSPDGLFNYTVMSRLQTDYPALGKLDERLKLFDKLHAELEEQILREQYDVERPAPQGEKSCVGYGYTGAVK